MLIYHGVQVFNRPFCDDFLKFCFDHFDVDMDHSTQTGFQTLENSHKPLVCKELRKFWENTDPSLSWRKGDYNESNTLLLDDSPYKGLLNPLHIAIFPYFCQYRENYDNSLGPGGDLRADLELLLSCETVQKYVKHHPIGQNAINEADMSWVLLTDNKQYQRYFSSEFTLSGLIGLEKSGK